MTARPGAVRVGARYCPTVFIPHDAVEGVAGSVHFSSAFQGSADAAIDYAERAIAETSYREWHGHALAEERQP